MSNTKLHILWTGFVVTASDGTIFGVFGHAGKTRADATAATLNANPGPIRFYVDKVARRVRPSVGTKL